MPRKLIEVKLPVFTPRDLVGRTLKIREINEDENELVYAVDQSTLEIFVVDFIPDRTAPNTEGVSSGTKRKGKN